MAQNMKFHAIALTGICCAVTALYYVMGPQESQKVAPGTVTGDRYIQIDSATWGEACNPYIKDALAARANAPIAKDAKDAEGKPVKPPELNMATHDNVLPAVSNRCNGKLTCDVNPTSDWLGVEPMASCAKKLEVGYRCFAYDRLWKLTMEQRKTTKIDCTQDATTPKTGADAQAPAAK